MKKSSSVVYYLKLFFLAFVISLPIILPYFKTGYFPTHDGEWAVVRLADMYREIKSFEIPARFSGYLNFQFGYPLFNFEYPMPYYVGVVLVFLKFGFVNSIKFLFASSVVFSFFSMFLLSKSLWKTNWAGFISSIFYIYAPYRIVDLYVRGSLGESLSFVLFPFILLAVKKIYYDKQNSLVSVFFVGFLYALLIVMHNIMAVLFGLVILLIAAASLLKRNFYFLGRLLLALIYSLGLSAFFWLPALVEKNLILLSKIPIADRSLYFVKLSQIIIPKWGYGVPTGINGFGYQIGIPQIAVFILAIVLIIIKKNKTSDSKLVLMLIVATVIISSLMFSPSLFIWQHTPLLSEINYPWTILSVIMLLISLMAGYLATCGKKYTALSLVLAALAIVMILPHAKPSTTFNKGDAFYTTNQGTTTSSNELMPLWVKTMPLRQPDKKIENLNGRELINTMNISSNKILFNVFLSTQREIQVNTIYFPGWTAYVNGQKKPITYDNPQGVMRLKLNKGENNVKLVFKETSLRLFSDYVSLLSFFGFFAIYIIHKKRGKSY